MRWKYNKLPWTRKVFTEIIKDLDRPTPGRLYGLSLPNALAAADYQAYARKHGIVKERKETRRALARLQAKKLLKLSKQGEQLMFSLSQKGVEEVLKQRIVETKKRLPKGCLCYVSFDIPKKMVSVRYILMALLKRVEFVMAHQSLWVTHKDVGEDLASLVRLMGAHDLIHVMVGTAKTKLPNVHVSVKS